jgi:hypothetical protein
LSAGSTEGTSVKRYRAKKASPSKRSIASG